MPEFPTYPDGGYPLAGDVDVSVRAGATTRHVPIIPNAQATGAVDLGPTVVAGSVNQIRHDLVGTEISPVNGRQQWALLTADTMFDLSSPPGFPSGSVAEVLLFAMQDATGYHEFGFQGAYDGMSLEQPWGAPFANLAPGAITVVRILFLDGLAYVMPMGPRDISGIDTPPAFEYGESYTFRREFDSNSDLLDASYYNGATGNVNWTVRQGALCPDITASGANWFVSWPHDMPVGGIVEAAVSVAGTASWYSSCGLVVGADMDSSGDLTVVNYFGFTQDTATGQIGAYRDDLVGGAYASHTTSNNPRLVGRPYVMRLVRDSSTTIQPYFGTMGAFRTIGPPITAGFTPNRIGFFAGTVTPYSAGFHYLRAWTP